MLAAVILGGLALVGAVGGVAYVAGRPRGAPQAGANQPATTQAVPVGGVIAPPRGTTPAPPRPGGSYSDPGAQVIDAIGGVVGVLGTLGLNAWQTFGAGASSGSGGGGDEPTFQEMW